MGIRNERDGLNNGGMREEKWQAKAPLVAGNGNLHRPAGHPAGDAFS